MALWLKLRYITHLMVGEIMSLLQFGFERTERPSFVSPYIREFGGLSAVFLMVCKVTLS
jgi:hypothetical protein